MPFNGRLLTAAAALAEDPVNVKIGGSSFYDWTDVDIDSDIFTPADGFTLSGIVPDPRYLNLFREGVSLDVYVGEDRQMAGVIDDVEITGSKEQTRIHLSGRDKGAFLVDNETKALRFSNYTLQSLAEALLVPSWGIKNVIISNEDNRRVQEGKHEMNRFKPGKKIQAGLTTKTVRKQTKIDPGQTIASVLDQHCKRDGLIWWMTAQGDLFIGKPQYDQDPTFEFLSYSSNPTDRQRTNVLSWNVRREIAERYSEIVVVGQTAKDNSNNPGALGSKSVDEAKAKKFRGVATDPDLKARGIQRRLIISDSDALNSKMTQERADEDMGRRRLQALTIQVVVPGFKQDGRLFTTDTLANVVIEEAGINGQFWISSRRFTEERGQRRTRLTLHETKVYLP